MYFATPPLAIIDHPADARHCAQTPLINHRYIIIHATAGTNSLAWLSTHPDSNVSAHRLIAKDGTIYKIVPDNIQAHHAGNATIGDRRNLNPTALGIEVENLNNGKDPYTEEQMASCVAQVAEWWGAYGALPILGHWQVDQGKSDPRGFDWPSFWSALFLAVARYKDDKPVI